MSPLRHGYTNETTHTGHKVVKRYLGKGAEQRCDIERLCLKTMSGRVPVSKLLETISPVELAMTFMEGSHGQELMDANRAAFVLRLSGELLAELQHVSIDDLGWTAGSSEVLVHGDFGPQNLIIDPKTQRVKALLDWEFAHVGMPIEDLAWAEWIVRMHHPNQSHHVTSLFAGYGERPEWSDRQAEMVRRCEQLVRFSEWQEWAAPARMWRERTRITHGWTE